ncbi:hypothetical protein FPOA_13847 [Fusarium poae]|uniref:Uncharacterized protein n=1 Tax=Fusarium poae TaxID=36050 RepID=A0A1B8A452_FUSPO|nr:hypothetical protein FPOA_13847 [Fusarium poae]
MGRRALTTEQKAEKAARRRDRDREQRLVASQNKQTQNAETDIPSQPVPDRTQADPGIPRMPLYLPFHTLYDLYLRLTIGGDGLQSSQSDLLSMSKQSPSHATRPRRRSPRLGGAPSLTTDKPVIPADEAVWRPDITTQLRSQAQVNSEQIPADTIGVATPYSTNTDYRNAAETDEDEDEDKDEDEETSIAETPYTGIPSQDEPIAAIPVSRPEADCILSPGSQIRNRVQRYRDRKHAARLQQIFQEATESQDLPFTDGFSALRLTDDTEPSLSLPAGILDNEPGSLSVPVPESEPELGDGG